jgi:phage terminase Nu1 subunit (DNA packaging protein)
MATASKLALCKPQSDTRRTVPVTSGRLLTPGNLAEITGLSIETLAQWRSQRRGIPFVKISRNCVRYRQADLDRWLEERIVRVENDPSNARRNN